MRKKPKTGEGRGNKRRQSQPGRDVGGAKHETGRNGQNDKRHGRERTEAGAAKEGNKESEQNKIKISAGLVSGGTCILELARKSEVSDSTNSMIWSFDSGSGDSTSDHASEVVNCIINIVSINDRLPGIELKTIS
ncbi:hypothetical protein TNCV_2174961 [Trichonephila clavipes]|nr:hypothetical protein TNCV_2174961 [Trichonephila clavipes]